MTPEAQQSVGVKEPLWWIDYPTTHLSDEEKAKFNGLTWISTTVRQMEYPQPSFGVDRIIIGSTTGITIINQNEQGNLVKRCIPQQDKEIVLLGAGPMNSNATIYKNDNRIIFGPADNFLWEERRIFFQKRIGLNSQKIQEAMDVAEELLVAVQQDRTSRQIKQAQEILLENLASSMRKQDSAILLGDVRVKLAEAAVESGLVKASRAELPRKIISLADKIEAAGIKAIEYGRDGLMLWPKCVREMYNSETDGYA